MRFETEITYNGKELYVVYEYHEGEKEIRYDSNHTGTPGHDPYVELHEIWAICKDAEGEEHCVNVTDLFDGDDFETIEEKIVNNY